MPWSRRLIRARSSGRASGALRVLSLGYTRDLWDGARRSFGDTRARLMRYADAVEEYHVVAHSLIRHRLERKIRLAGGFWAYATGGRGRVHSWLVMITIGVRIARQRSIHVIQSQDPLVTGSAALVVKLLTGRPYNVCVYGPNPFDRHWRRSHRLHGLVAPLMGWVLRQADGIQVDGDRTARSIRRRLPGVPLVVKPMVPLNIARFLEADSVAALRRRLSANGRYTFVGVFVGRVVAQKNIGLLLAAAAIVRATRSDIVFWVIGAGSALPGLRRVAARRQLADTVHWHPPVSHHEVPAIMASADFVVLTSDYEGMPRAVIEAAATGTKIVMTHVSGSDEVVVPGETGWVVPVGDACGIARAVADATADGGRTPDAAARARTQARDFVARHADPLRQIRWWETIVESHRNSQSVT